MIDQTEEYSDDSLFNITSWGADMTFRELANMYEEGELSKPEFQRNYVWSKVEASRFIESILLGLPVPSIFLANYRENEKLIIDGYQRIMTMYYFIVRRKFASEMTVFRLVNSPRINARWRNKSFEELSIEDQRKLRSSTIHAIIFEQKSPKDDDTSMFQIFSRINTSGRTLNAQEIRNCICQGNFNLLLLKLNNNEQWRKLYGNDLPDPRMRDLELILRFFGMCDIIASEQEKRQINLRQYLDIYMKNCSQDSLSQKEKDFNEMIDLAYRKFGDVAFTASRDGSCGGKINPTIFDAIAVAIHEGLKSGATTDFCTKDARNQLLMNDEFVQASKFRTTDIENIKKRVTIAKEMLFGRA